MATSPTELEATPQPSDTCSTLARALAPEDVRPGDFVALLDEMHELPSFWWCLDSALHPRDRLVRLRMIPTHESLPLRVKSVCLPFVLTKQPSGQCRTLDLRRCHIARLDRTFATAAWKAYKKKKQAIAKT
jgi:hypothetical protein